MPQGTEEAVAAALCGFADRTASFGAVTALSLLLEERIGHPRTADGVDLVWSGPEAAGSVNRDTAVVVRELFERAERSVLVATYALDAGDRARTIFQPLATRLDRGDALDVSLFVNVHPPADRRQSAPDTLAAFQSRFRGEVWPGRVLPPVFYDPRSLVTKGPNRASMHAKCVIIDDRIALVTSANFTAAAQHRNVEVGALLASDVFARSLRAQFENLRREGAFVQLDSVS